jgi:hypothetical protein
VELVLVFETGMEGIDPVVLVDVVSVLELLVVVVVFFAGLVLRLALRV